MTDNRNEENTAKSMHAVMGNYPVGATGGSIPDTPPQNAGQPTPVSNQAKIVSSPVKQDAGEVPPELRE